MGEPTRCPSCVSVSSFLFVALRTSTEFLIHAQNSEYSWWINQNYAFNTVCVLFSHKRKKCYESLVAQSRRSSLKRLCVRSYPSLQNFSIEAYSSKDQVH